MVNITRYEPFEAVEDMFRNAWTGLPLMFQPVVNNLRKAAIPADVWETDEAYLITAELPGVKKTDIEVNIQGSTVSLRADVKEEKDAQHNAKQLLSERKYGMRTCTITLADELDESKAQGKHEDGILQLILPKTAAHNVKRLEIH